MGECNAELKFLFMPYMAQTDEVIACLKHHPEVVIVSQSNHPDRLGEHRALVHQLMTEEALGFILFRQIPDFWSIIGYCIIAGVAVWMFVYTARKDRSSKAGK